MTMPTSSTATSAARTVAQRRRGRGSCHTGQRDRNTGRTELFDRGPSRFIQRVQLLFDARELAFDVVLDCHHLCEPDLGVGGPPFELTDCCLRLPQRIVAAGAAPQPAASSARRSAVTPCRLGRRPLDRLLLRVEAANALLELGGRRGGPLFQLADRCARLAPGPRSDLVTAATSDCSIVCFCASKSVDAPC